MWHPGFEEPIVRGLVKKVEQTTDPSAVLKKNQFYIAVPMIGAYQI